VIIRKVRIETEGSYGHTPNGDGVDPSSCKNVLIENCNFDTGDDCIAIKAGRDKDGLRVNRPTENVVIRNCRGLRGHGGIVIGSETSGGIRNVYAVNCQFKGTDRIVRIKTARGRGGILENMWFKDIIGEDILSEALHLNMLYTGTRLPAQPVVSSTPSVRNIHFDNIKCISGKSYTIEILGLPEMLIRTITFDRIYATSTKGINIADADGITIQNSEFKADVFPVVTITDGKNVSFDSSEFPGVTDRFLRIDGESSQNISLRNISLKNIEKLVILGPNVSRKAVVVAE
jgi:DNA sulfur modification protein DndE